MDEDNGLLSSSGIGNKHNGYIFALKKKIVQLYS